MFKATTYIPNIKICENNVLYQKYEGHKGTKTFVVRIKWVGGIWYKYIIFNRLLIKYEIVL